MRFAVFPGLGALLLSSLHLLTKAMASLMLRYLLLRSLLTLLSSSKLDYWFSSLCLSSIFRYLTRITLG